MAIFDKVDYIDIEPALQYMYREQSSNNIVIIANQLGAKDYVSSILSNKMLRCLEVAWQYIYEI